MESSSIETSKYPVVWDNAWNIGIDEIDNQHHELISVVNRLHEYVRDGSSPDNLNDIVGRMIDYVRMHFATEERIMMRENFDGLDEHRIMHVMLTKKLLGIHTRSMTDGVIDGVKLQDFLAGWLTNHLAKADGLFREYLRKKRAVAP